jgi:hypothetical protein
MKCTNATKFHRKSGGAQWRDLLFTTHFAKLKESAALPLSSRGSRGICGCPFGSPQTYRGGK